MVISAMRVKLSLPNIHGGLEVAVVVGMEEAMHTGMVVLVVLPLYQA